MKKARKIGVKDSSTKFSLLHYSKARKFKLQSNIAKKFAAMQLNTENFRKSIKKVTLWSGLVGSKIQSSQFV